MSGSVEERLRAEAEFQNKRIEDLYAGSYEPRERFYYLADKAMQRYYDSFGDVTGKRVVVVGCSEGGIQQHARAKAIVTGIDISDEAVAHLNKEIEASGWSGHADAKVMNAEDLDFPDDSIDLICCSGVLHHLDVDAAARSWARVLKPTGKVSMVEPMAYNPPVALYRWATPSMRTPDEHPLTPKDFAILRRYFATVDIDAHVLTSLFSVPMTYVSKKAGRIASGILEKLDNALLDRFPTLKYFCWTAVIELSNPR